jgi:hypothetical protein
VTHEQALKSLIEACERVRSQAGYFRPRRVHEVYADDWQAWSKQIKGEDGTSVVEWDV